MRRTCIDCNHCMWIDAVSRRNHSHDYYWQCHLTGDEIDPDDIACEKFGPNGPIMITIDGDANR